MATETVAVRLDETWKPLSLDNSGPFSADVVGFRDALFFVGDSIPANGTYTGLRQRSIPPTTFGTAKVYARAVEGTTRVNVSRTVNAGNASTPVFQALGLSASALSTAAQPGTVIGTLTNRLSGSTTRLLTNTNTFALSSDGSTLVAGLIPAEPGKKFVTVRESHPDAGSNDTTLEVTVSAPALSISGANATATEGQDFNWTPAVSGGYGRRSFRLIGSLPTGWSMSSTTGAVYAPGGFISASMPAVSGFSIAVRDEAGNRAQLDGITFTPGAGGGGGPLELSANTFDLKSLPGRLIGVVTGMAPGSVLKSVPNDGRIATAGNRVLVGLTAASAGPFASTLREVRLDGTTRDLPVTFTAVDAAIAPLNAMQASAAPKAIFGMRRINPAYAGACCQVRDSANTLRTVAFDANGDVDQAQFAAWGDGVTFTVSLWYDQSGNGNNVTASTRPRLVLSAYTDARGIARPAVDGAAKGMFLGGSAAAFTAGGTENFAAFVIANTLGYSTTATGNSPRPGSFSSSVVAPVISLGSTSAGLNAVYAADDPQRQEGADASASTTFMRLKETVLDFGAPAGSGFGRYKNFWYNQKGALVSGGIDSRIAFRDREHRIPAYGPDVLTIGANAQRATTFNGQIVEVIIFNGATPLSDAECQRIAVEQRAYWGSQITDGAYLGSADSFRPSVLGALERGDWALASDGVHPPIESYTPSGTAYETSAVFGITPAYGVKRMRWAWSNWWTLSDGREPPERDTGNDIAVRAALFADGVKVQDLTFGGQFETTIASGADVWCDEVVLPATWTKKEYAIRTYCRYTGTRPGGYRAGTGVSASVSRKATSDAEALGLLNGGTITDNQTGNGVFFYGPSLAISDGWDGRPVVLVVGDSIAFGDYEARSWITKGLGGEAGGQDLPYANFAVQGTRPANSYSIGAGFYRRKDQLLRSGVAINGGRALWTAILSEHGVNDAGGVGSQATLTLASKVFGFDRFAHYRYRPPGAKLVHTTFTPRVQPLVDTDWLYSYPDTAQSTTADPTTDRWGVSDQINADTWPLSGHIDVRPAWTGLATGTKWRDAQGTGLLTAAVAIGDTQYLADTAPAKGDIAVLDAGTAANVEAIQSVSDVTGTGPFTVKLSGAATKAHASGAAVRYATTKDGVHPFRGTVGWNLAAKAVADAKVAGVFG